MPQQCQLSEDFPVEFLSFPRSASLEKAEKRAKLAVNSCRRIFLWYNPTMILLANRSGEKCEILERNWQGMSEGNRCHYNHRQYHQYQKKQCVWHMPFYPKEIPLSICEMNLGHFSE